MNVVTAINDFRRMVSGPKVDAGHRRATVIAVAAQKGGVGKTTSAVHLAAGLAQFHGLKTLLIDMDAQGHVGMSTRAINRGATGETLSEVLLQKKRDLQEVVRPTRIDGLWGIESDRDLNTTEQLMAARIGKELLLKNALKLARTHFDVIVIDCPPNTGSLTVNALVAADRVMIPCDLSLLSLDGVTGMLETVETVQETLNPQLQLLGLLRTRVDRRNQTVNAAIEKTLEERYGAALLRSDIGIATDITKAQLAGVSVFEHAPRSRAAASYESLCLEVHERLFGHARALYS